MEQLASQESLEIGLGRFSAEFLNSFFARIAFKRAEWASRLAFNSVGVPWLIVSKMSSFMHLIIGSYAGMNGSYIEKESIVDFERWLSLLLLPNSNSRRHPVLTNFSEVLLVVLESALSWNFQLEMHLHTSSRVPSKRTNSLQQQTTTETDSP